MKKLLSIVLAVAMMSVMAFSASAAETVDLLAACAEGKIYPNDANYATMTVNDDGSYEVVVTQDASADLSTAYGLAIEPFMSDVDLTATPYLQVELTCDVPFRVTLLDKNAAGETKWITFGSEFFNTFVAEGKEAPAAAPENNFFPAGSYDCFAYLEGFYTWQANNGGVGYDPAAANITGLYIELKEAGTLKVSKMDLAATDGTEGGDEGGDTTDTDTNTGSNSTENPKTGDASQAVTFAVVALAATGVVVLSVVSKKAKFR